MKKPSAILFFLIISLLPRPGLCFYNASEGRWLNRDPVAERGGQNIYAFVRNRPTTAVDRNGLNIFEGAANILSRTLSAINSGMDGMSSGAQQVSNFIDSEGFTGGALNWFLAGNDVHVPFSAYDPGWSAFDFSGFAGIIRSVCWSCPSRASVRLSRVRDLYREGLATILMKGGPGNITVRLRGNISTFSDTCPCRWRFRGQVTIATDPFDFDPHVFTSGRTGAGEMITVGVWALHNTTGVGHDFMTYFDGGRPIDITGACNENNPGMSRFPAP